ncbi:hypothetical protein Tcan_01971 [Toxocara canis]|uniref:Uncharacterized protein n=1 Tax=Toxocara canis TaxID=6265 RepID=A0A0B2VUC3_TOXCA|nr:hypothetical protein Tcan_01971 [Toxocara canis]
MAFINQSRLIQTGKFIFSEEMMEAVLSGRISSGLCIMQQAQILVKGMFCYQSSA